MKDVLKHTLFCAGYFLAVFVLPNYLPSLFLTGDTNYGIHLALYAVGRSPPDLNLSLTNKNYRQDLG